MTDLVEARTQLYQLLKGRQFLELSAEWTFMKGLPLKPPEMVFTMLKYWSAAPKQS